MVALTPDAIRAADAAGDLIGAGTLAQRLVLAASGAGDLRGQADALLLLARVSRHRRTAASLRRARDAAGIAVELAGTTGLASDAAFRAAAELEQAASLVASGHLDEGFAIAAVHRSAERAAIAGWSWTTMGQARLAQGVHREAVAALSNALAEFQRDAASRRVYVARIALAVALTRAGHIDDGAAILDADIDYWASSGIRRLQIEHHLALAENLRQRGSTAKSRKRLAEVAGLLEPCTGMDATTVRLHQQRAACDLDWHLVNDARKRITTAEAIRVQLAEGEAAGPVAAGVPRPAVPQPLGARGGQPTLPTRDLHHDLADAAQELADATASETPDALPGTLALSGSAVLELGREVRSLVAWAKRSGTLDDHAIGGLLVRLESLGTVPDAERLEATMLVRAGKLLRTLDQPRLLDAERLLRRALIRLARLPGMGLWQARANVALAMILRDTDRHEEALSHALRGVERFDAERFEMGARATREVWGKRHNDAFNCAIDLANSCGRTDIAADLITFTRAAGVVRGSVGQLVAVPRLRYIDGVTSGLGSGEPTLFV